MNRMTFFNVMFGLYLCLPLLKGFEQIFFYLSEFRIWHVFDVFFKRLRTVSVL